MSANEILLAALKDLDMTKGQAAKRNDWTPQQLANRITRGSMRADEFLDLMDAIGVEVSFTIRETGKKVRAHANGAGRRVKGMIDGEIYDTAESEVLANSFYSDGVNKYNDGVALELYLSRNGKYFFAEYGSWEGAKDRVSLVSAEEAAAFIEKYGTTIFKEPKE